MIEIITVDDALKWFEQDPNFESEYRKNINGETEFFSNDFLKDKKHPYRETYYDKQFKNIDYDADSSPLAWEHFIRFYDSENFGYITDTCINSKNLIPYSFERLKYQKKRIFAAIEIDSNKKGKTIENCEYKERLGGDTDFNFKNQGNKKTKSKIEQFIIRLVKQEKIDTIIEKNTFSNTKEAPYEVTIKPDEDIDNKPIDNCEKNSIRLLHKCFLMHHTLLNFSLMQASGGLNDFKGCLCDYDRLDRFVFFLNQHYKTAIKDKRNTAIAIHSSVANRSVLIHYLNQFDNIYDYCAKIYFLPTKLYHTGKMFEKGIDITNDVWNELFTSNEKLIADLIKWGAEDFKENTPCNAEYNKALTINYMLLAVRFWQAKETYFNLIDQ